MATVNSWAEHQRLILQRMGRVAEACRAETDAEASAVMRDAIALTSGTESSDELRRRGHPYSRRRPMATRRLPVNRQSGALQSGFVMSGTNSGGRSERTLTNRARHATFALAPYGTKSTVARGFWTELQQRAKSRFPRRVEAAVRREEST